MTKKSHSKPEKKRRRKVKKAKRSSEEDDESVEDDAGSGEVEDDNMHDVDAAEEEDASELDDSQDNDQNEDVSEDTDRAKTKESKRRKVRSKDRRKTDAKLGKRERVSSLSPSPPGKRKKLKDKKSSSDRRQDRVTEIVKHRKEDRDRKASAKEKSKVRDRRGKAEDDSSSERKSQNQSFKDKSSEKDHGSRSNVRGKDRKDKNNVREKEKPKGKIKEDKRHDKETDRSRGRKGKSRSPTVKKRKRTSRSRRGRDKSSSRKRKDRRKARSSSRSSSGEVHHGVACDKCGVKPIKGSRFKCDKCPNYSLCERCYPKREKVHMKNHKFFVAKAGVTAVAAEPSEDESSSPPPIGDLFAKAPPLPKSFMNRKAEFIETPLIEQQTSVVSLLKQRAAEEQEPTPAGPPAGLSAQQMQEYMMSNLGRPAWQRREKEKTPNQLPPGWETGVHPDTGKTYYFNRSTGESKWDRPTDVPVETQTASKADDAAKGDDTADAAEDEAMPDQTEKPVWPQKLVVSEPVKKGDTCRLCAKRIPDRFSAVKCRRKRPDGSVGGCGAIVCWRCMKRAPRDKFGSVRTTREEFGALGETAWWMHEKCMMPFDRFTYFGGGQQGGDFDEEMDPDFLMGQMGQMLYQSPHAVGPRPYSATAKHFGMTSQGQSAFSQNGGPGDFPAGAMGSGTSPGSSGWGQMASTQKSITHMAKAPGAHMSSWGNIAPAAPVGRRPL